MTEECEQRYIAASLYTFQHTPLEALLAFLRAAEQKIATRQ